MTASDPAVVVFRKGTEGLSTEHYAEAIRDRLPDVDVALARTPHEERELLRNARFATGTSIDEDHLNAAEDLELFQAASSGYNHLPMDELTERGVRVANAAGIHAPGIAEQALGFCLVFARRIHEGWTRKQGAEWRHYKAGEFTGSTVTVVGLGAIGQAFVDRLQGMDVHTIGVRYTPEKGGPTDEVVGFDDRAVHDALARTDYLVLATPLTETTEKLIGPDELATLPPEAVVINVCRGGVIDTDALLKSLQTEDVRGAALDVTDPEPLPADHPLWNLDNVLLTPHMGGHTPEHWNRLADILAQNVRALQRDDPGSLRNVVNDHAGDR
jgi:phosphoglycerate dehydrogenase-like enzyme